jgi:prepilin-type N-terminal cleavage/methylation domain-containing protein/prepilin-type processing-associated H-X9-DG protein
MDVQRSRRSFGFTLVELLVVVGIIAMLVAFLLPTLNRARQQAATTQCMANLHQIGQAVSMYANQSGGFTVPGYADPATTCDRENWATTLINSKLLPPPTNQTGNIATEPLMTATVFHCPSALDDEVGTEITTSTANWPYPNDRRAAVVQRPYRIKSFSSGIVVDVWYGLNADVNNFNVDNSPCRRVPWNGDWTIPKLSRLRRSAQMVMMYDGTALGLHFDADRLGARHGTRSAPVTNLLLFDGHVESVLTASLPGGLGPNTKATDRFTINNLKNYPAFLWRLDQ